jgi:hypothetical protein
VQKARALVNFGFIKVSHISLDQPPRAADGTIKIATVPTLLVRGGRDVTEVWWRLPILQGTRHWSSIHGCPSEVIHWHRQDCATSGAPLLLPGEYRQRSHLASARHHDSSKNPVNARHP